MDSAAGLWERERLSVGVRVYQHLSCLLLRCAGCWLTALPRLLHFSQPRANRECKQKLTHRPYRQNPPDCSPLFPQSLLVAFSGSRHLILPHLAFRCETAPPLSFHRSRMRSESSLNRPDQKGALIYPNAFLPTQVSACYRVHFL